jgi:hypothetical protein
MLSLRSQTHPSSLGLASDGLEAIRIPLSRYAVALAQTSLLI